MSKYNRSGQYELIDVTITTNTENPVKLDMSRSFMDVSIYESIFDKFISGNLSFVDVHNIAQKYSLGNGETVTIQWNTTGINETKKVELICYGIRGPMSLGNKASGYTLDLCSKNLIDFKREKLYSPFNNSPSEIIKTIVDNIEVAPTKETLVGVFTGQNKIEGIDYLCENASGQNGYNGFVFYESTDGLKFKAVEELYDQEHDVEFTNRPYGVFNDARSSFEETFNNIQSINILEGNSYLESISDGALGITVSELSLDTKETTTNNFNIETASVKTLGDNKLLNSTILGTEDKKKVCYTLRPFANNNKTMNQLVLYSLCAVEIEISVIGNSSINVGDTCIASIPSYSADDFSEKDFDAYSGKFLITEIKHTLTPDNYDMSIKLCKDSTEEAIG